MTALLCRLGRDEAESFHKIGSPPLVWSNRGMVHCSPYGAPMPHVLHLAFSPCRWFSSVCLLSPSPREASIKSPLWTTTGLDSYKLEQNNLFPKLHVSMPVPICPKSSAAEAASTAVRQRALLVYWCTLYWCELNPSGNTFGCHTPRFLSLPAFYFLCPCALMYLLWQGGMRDS